MSSAFLAVFSCKPDHPVPPFDGDRAYEMLVRQCDFGPRVPGTEAHRKCLRFLSDELVKRGARVNHQSFSQKLPQADTMVTMTNIIASFGLDNSERVLLCAHWDSRPWADQDSLPEHHTKPILGANDGASGVAVLLEVARAISVSEPVFGVDIILFDGEDSGLSGRENSFALGAQYFARTRDPRYRPVFGILLDMVGDRDLQIYQEENSLQYAPQVVQKVWQRARDLNLASFIPRPKFQVSDDHLPLLQAGISCIDLIDFDYPYWHTLQDTPDKCSPASLQQVGQLLLSLIYQE